MAGQSANIRDRGLDLCKYRRPGWVGGGTNQDLARLNIYNILELFQDPGRAFDNPCRGSKTLNLGDILSLDFPYAFEPFLDLIGGDTSQHNCKGLCHFFRRNSKGRSRVPLACRLEDLFSLVGLGLIIVAPQRYINS